MNVLEIFEDKLSINSILPILGVSTSGYYDYLKREPSREPSRQAVLKEEVKDKIKDIHDESFGIYGAPKIKQMLHQTGYKTSQKTVKKLYERDEYQSSIH